MVISTICLCFVNPVTCSNGAPIEETYPRHIIPEEFPKSLITRAFDAAATSRHSQFSCLHFTETQFFIDAVGDPLPILMALYSTIHASAQGSWASQLPSNRIAVNYGRLQLLMESPLTAIPWSFVADFAWEMLSNIVQAGDPGIALYTAYYRSPTSSFGQWNAYYATAEAANLIYISLKVLSDPGHILPRDLTLCV